MSFIRIGNDENGGTWINTEQIVAVMPSDWAPDRTSRIYTVDGDESWWTADMSVTDLIELINQGG